MKEGKSLEYENEQGEKYQLRKVKEYDSILKEPIIIGIFSCFCCLSTNVSPLRVHSFKVFQSGMESSITLLTKWLLGWDQVQNAIIFVVSGIGAILSYGTVTLISTKKILDDRQILLGSCFMCFVALGLVGILTWYDR